MLRFSLLQFAAQFVGMAFALRLEPLAMFPQGYQSAVQAAQPTQVDVHYDVPSSFLTKPERADVFFDHSNPSAIESSYQSVLQSMQNSVRAEINEIRENALSGSFMKLKAQSDRDPKINLFIAESNGKLIDQARLRNDVLTFAQNEVMNLQNDLIKAFR